MRNRKRKDLTFTLEEVARIQAQLVAEHVPPAIVRPSDPTWADLEHREGYCKIVAAMFAEIRAGAAREVAMMRAILRLSRQYQELRDQALEIVQLRDERPSGW